MQIKSIIGLMVSCSLFLAGCDDSTDSIADAVIDTVETEVEDVIDNIVAVDPSLFALNSLESIEMVDCTLSNGDASTCYSVTVNGFPADRNELGPFCPESTETTAEDAGKWFDGGVLYDLTGSFVSNLSVFYGDSKWQLYDKDTGLVNITDTQLACEAAARPDVAAEYNNFCVQCDISYYNEAAGEGVSSTYLIPVTPVLRDTPADIEHTDVGVAFNGVNLAAAAPTQAILSAYTIAAFDDCIGHVNPVAGYHYHGANHGDGTCPAIDYENDGHGGAFAYAMDGFAIHSMLNQSGEEETDLDECRGHSDDNRGYHYHAAGAGENTFIGCFAGEVAR